jgi:hypothetical protein
MLAGIFFKNQGVAEMELTGGAMLLCARPWDQSSAPKQITRRK